MYESFAQVYDLLMRDVPYGEWADRIDGWIREYGISRPSRDAAGKGRAKKAKALEDRLAEERDLVVDLGCGTGRLTAMLADRGYDVAGVDLSPEMLAAAQETNRARRKPIPYLCQDMRRLDLYCTAGTFVCVCDSINYLLTDRDLHGTFQRVRNFLFPGGVFIFDFNTVHKYRDVIGTRTITEDSEDVSFIWENTFRAARSRNEAAITFFAREADGRYRRFEETHVQRGFTMGEMRRLLNRAGLKVLAAFDERNGKDPNARSERIFVIAGDVRAF